MSPIPVTAEELVVHAFASVDPAAGGRPHRVVHRMWEALRAELGCPVEATGAPVAAPADLAAAHAEEVVLAVQQSADGAAQAVLRRRDGVLNLSALFTGDAGWAEHERRWVSLVGDPDDAVFGEVRIYFGHTAPGSGPDLPATAELGAAAAVRLPLVPTAKGWERTGVTTADGFPIWELTPREPGRGLRRLLVLTPRERDGELSAWVWSDGRPTAPLLARYLAQAAVVRKQVRDWDRGRAVARLRTRLAVATSAVRAGTGPDDDAVDLDATATLAALAGMRLTAEIAADNMARMPAGLADGGLFADDRALALDAQAWLADEHAYLLLDRDLLREVRAAPARTATRGPAPQATGPTIGLITAMAVEFHAMRSLLDDPVESPSVEHAHYVHATLPSLDPRQPHRVVLVQTGATATNAAADATTNLVRSHPAVRCLVMVGVAAGVPAPTAPQRHVRLGDIVLATWGIADYAHLVVTEGGAASRRAVFPRPWHYLTRVSERLEADELADHRPWERWLDEAEPGFRRPPDTTDLLAPTTPGGSRPRHPRRTLSGHRPDRPKVHKGVIGSADISLRDGALRDGVAAEHNLRAVEMEGAGVGTSAFLNDRHWFMVRGVSDYADTSYTFRWRPYAALTAAAYLRALLAAAHPLDQL
jgi:nucleoside phosphorylase